MRYSKLFGKTIRKVSQDVKIKSQEYLIRGGFVDQTAAGLYSFLPLGFRVLEKIDRIVKEELAKEGVQHLLMPYVSPADLWQESGRLEKMADVLVKFTSKRGQELVLSPTHEEIITDLARKFIKSYRDLPAILSQNQLKFRDEIRVFGGPIRTREFIMQDAYSFDADDKGVNKSFDLVVRAYKSIFKKLGLGEVLEVEADSGTIGGTDSHEFIVLVDIGEDRILECDKCQYRANVEKAEFKRMLLNLEEEEKPFQIIDQPEWVETMEDNVKHYGQPPWRYLKNVVYKDENGRIIIASIRGDQEVNEPKLKRAANVSILEPASDKDLEKLGTKHGWVHSWGIKGVTYVGDLGLKMVKNFIGGQKEKTTDSINVNYGHDFEYEILVDIVSAKEGDWCPNCEGKLKEKRGIEIGHAFKLGAAYSKSMDAQFLDKDSKLKYLLMGCYGFGVSRAVSLIAELKHDEKGIIWPKSVAPYQAHLIELRAKSEKRKAIVKSEKLYAEEVYQKLTNVGIEVLYDDREEISAGVKFSDADLIGIPIRLVVSEKTKDKIEFKERDSNNIELLSLEEVIDRLKQ